MIYKLLKLATSVILVLIIYLAPSHPFLSSVWLALGTPGLSDQAVSAQDILTPDEWATIFWHVLLNYCILNIAVRIAIDWYFRRL